MSDPILIWNDIALEANRISHTDGSKEQNGPTLSSRALAIVHLAMYDTYASICKTAQLPPYIVARTETPINSPQNLAVAVAAAAFTTLVQLYPSQFDYFEQQLKINGGSETDSAHNYGVAAAGRVLDVRKNDPGASQGLFRPAKRRGIHKVDPDNPSQGYHAPFYGEKSRCFAVSNRKNLKLDPPPFNNGRDEEYLKDLRLLRTKGIKPEFINSVPENDETIRRTPEETLIGIYWGYDGASGLGTPPRLYNQIVRKIAIAKKNTPSQNAQLFALINVAMADAGILCWEEKYIHQLWRPIVGIREHDLSFGNFDGSEYPAKTKLSKDCDPFWLPLGSPSSNAAIAGLTTSQGKFPFASVQLGNVKNFTPNFPAYPSGHAAFGAAAFHMARLFYGVKPGDRQGDEILKCLKESDGQNISFISEELNGKTLDNTGTIRPLHRRTFKNGLWEMIIENAESRQFLGVHWTFDAFALREGKPDFSRKVGGVWLGLAVAENIYKNGLNMPVSTAL